MTKLLLILGPPGVGKSTLIEHLLRIDLRFTYIAPYTTRQLRPKEETKIHITPREMETLKSNGELLALNRLYGAEYGTPRRPIEIAFANGKFPVLDWPVSALAEVSRALSGRIVAVYLYPPSLSELQRRLRLRPDADVRSHAAEQEIHEFESGRYGGLVNLSLCTEDNMISEVAQRVYEFYIRATDESAQVGEAQNG